MDRGYVPDVELLVGLTNSLLTVYLCHKKYINLGYTTLHQEPLLPYHNTKVEVKGHIVKP